MRVDDGHGGAMRCHSRVLGTSRLIGPVPVPTELQGRWCTAEAVVIFWAGTAHPMHAAGISWATLSVVKGLDISPLFIAAHNVITTLVTGVLCGFLLAKRCFGPTNGVMCFVEPTMRCLRLAGTFEILTLGERSLSPPVVGVGGGRGLRW
jgi:hypothetical protein